MRQLSHHTVNLLSTTGFTAKGIVYLGVGVLTVNTAVTGLGGGGEGQDTQDVISEVLGQPFGRILLGVLALGMLFYVLWRMVQTFFDTQDKGSDKDGLMKRFIYFVSGTAHAFLAFSATRAAIRGTSGEGSDESSQAWSARVLEWPMGRWLLIAAGIIMVVVAVFQFRRAIKASFKKSINFSSFNERSRKWVLRVCSWGYHARGIIFGVIAYFLIQAGWQGDPDEARGMSGAMDSLSSQPYGTVILIVVALGLVAYGVYCFVRARYGLVGNAAQSAT